ncbi:MAG: glycerate kinase type-2 family protein, partial [Spirochaetota bacterium]
MNSYEKYIDELYEIFSAALERVNPYKMILEHIKLNDNTLIIEYEDDKINIDLNNFDKIYVLGAGKATATMAKGIEEVLKDKIDKGLISVKEGHTEKLKYIDIIEAGHPIPDKKSIEASGKIEELARGADEKTLIINLISGGGSALLSYPMEFKSDKDDIDVKLDLEDMQNTTKSLLECGATIKEINSIRKHISGIKGGKLAKLMYPATSVNFILSDVIGDRLDTIASGLTTYDDTTFKDAVSTLKKYDIFDKIPEKVAQVLKRGVDGKIPETPKSGDKIFDKVKFDYTEVPVDE